MFQYVPIVSSSRENANGCQHTPEVPRACECIVYMQGGVPAHQCSYAFQVLGAGHIQENPGRFL